jgi:hypothetical protein
MKSLKNEFRRDSINPPEINQYILSFFERVQIDFGWVILAILIIPISLLYPVVIMKGGSTSSIISNNNNSTNTNITNITNNNNVLAHHPLSFATIHAVTWTILVCIFMIRLLYRNQNSSSSSYNYSTSNSTTSSINMAVLLTALAPLSIFIYFVITLTVLYICLFETNTTNTTATTWMIVFIPFFLWIREVFLYRTYWTRLTDSINDMGYISRTTFFHELYTMSITEIILH